MQSVLGLGHDATRCRHQNAIETSQTESGKRVNYPEENWRLILQREVGKEKVWNALVSTAIDGSG